MKDETYVVRFICAVPKHKEYISGKPHYMFVHIEWSYKTNFIRPGFGSIPQRSRSPFEANTYKTLTWAKKAAAQFKEYAARHFAWCVDPKTIKIIKTMDAYDTVYYLDDDKCCIRELLQLRKLQPFKGDKDIYLDLEKAKGAWFDRSLDVIAKHQKELVIPTIKFMEE